MTSVMCFGTFDMLHPGHINYFEQAKQHGDYLIVVIARDQTKQLQNKPTKTNENQRLKNVQNQKIVDEAVLGNINNKLKVIQEHQPDILCLGYDQEADETELKQQFPSIEIKRLKPFQENKYKSSLLKKF